MLSPAESTPPISSEHTWRRRIFHLAAALLVPAAALILGYKPAFYLAAVGAAALAAVECVRLLVPAVNRRVVLWVGPLMKPRERRSPTAASHLAIASLLVLFLFGTPIATLALVFVALGDPVAGIVGTRYGRLRVRLVGSRPGSKSVEGTLAFFAVSLAAAAVLWAAGAHDMLWIAAVGAATAALVEFTPIPLEDNFTVPLASAFVMWLLWVT